MRFSRVRHQLVTLMIITQVLGNCKWVIVTVVHRYHTLSQDNRYTHDKSVCSASRSKKTSGEVARSASSCWKGKDLHRLSWLSSLPAIEDASTREVFDSTDDDFLEMVVQFGYACRHTMPDHISNVGIIGLYTRCFCSGGVGLWQRFVALLNNIVEIRTNCLKSAWSCCKPIARSASGIGVWYHALETLSVGAVLVNTAFLFLQVYHQPDAFLPEYSLGMKLGAVIVPQHIVLFAKFVLDNTIPDVPSDVRDRIAREQVEFSHLKTRQLKQSKSCSIITDIQKRR